MMGKPGSGKGTQARLLSKTMDFNLFSSGDSFRNLSKQDTPLGIKVKDVIDNGFLMPHWFASYMFEKEVFNSPVEQGIVFEGPGRKLPEAELFHEVMNWLGRPYRAIHLKVDECEIRERIVKRAEEEGRKDDQALDLRFEEYNKHTAHSVEFFREQGMLIEIDGMQTPEEVEKNILEELRKVDESLS